MIRIQIIEDDPDFVYLLRTMVGGEADMEIVSCGCERERCVAEAVNTQPDVVLLDLMLSEGKEKPMEGIGIAREIRLRTRARILILTSLEKPGTVLKAGAEAFASGYLFKSLYKQIPERVRTVYRGGGAEEVLICASLLGQLTVSERYALLHYLGYPVELHSSPKTLANQLSSTVRKLGLGRPDELAAVFSNYPDLKDMGDCFLGIGK